MRRKHIIAVSLLLESQPDLQLKKEMSYIKKFVMDKENFESNKSILLTTILKSSASARMNFMQSSLVLRVLNNQGE
jgi:hypothetical protein